MTKLRINKAQVELGGAIALIPPAAEAAGGTDKLMLFPAMILQQDEQNNVYLYYRFSVRPDRHDHQLHLRE